MDQGAEEASKNALQAAPVRRFHFPGKNLTAPSLLRFPSGFLLGGGQSSTDLWATLGGSSQRDQTQDM